MSDEARVPAWWAGHRFAEAAGLVVLVAIAASITGLSNGFAYDDIFVVQDNPAVQTLRAPWAYFLESYWGPARGHVALYRPLAVWGYALQWSIGGGPFLFHAVNVVLYALSAVLLLGVLRALLPAGPALIGAAIFAAHPVHVEAVANVVGQSELASATLVLACVLLFARARRAGALPGRTMAAITAMYLMALLFKEGSIVLPALLLLLEVLGPKLGFQRSGDTWPRSRLLVLVLGLSASLYLVWRQHILGAITGDEPFWGLRGLTGGERAWVMLGLLPHLVRLMLWPARLYADYSPQLVPLLSAPSSGHWIGGTLLVLIAGGAIWALRRRDALTLLALGWFGLTYLPVSNLPYPVGVLIAERTLFVPSVGVAILAARVLASAAEWTPPWRGAVLAAAVGLLGLGIAKSAARSPVWADNPTLFSVLAVEAPTNFRAPFALAEFNALGGRPRVADTLFQRAMRLYPEHLPSRLAYGQVLQIQGRCAEALPLFESAMREDPEDRAALVGTVICYLDLQRFEAARRLALVGNAGGWDEPRLRNLRAVAESVLVSKDSVDVRNRHWRAGRPVERSDRPLRIVVFRDESAKAAQMQRLGLSATPAPSSVADTTP